MSLDLPAGTRCFIDSNIFIYHFTQDPRYAAQTGLFFRRVVMGDLVAYTSPLAVADALHKIMLAEVQTRFAQPKPLSHIQRHPKLIAQLTGYRSACNDIGKSGVALLPVDFPMFLSIAAIAVQHQQLTNDASIIALMQRHSLADLVTNDDDFDAIPGLKLWKPR